MSERYRDAEGVKRCVACDEEPDYCRCPPAANQEEDVLAPDANVYCREIELRVNTWHVYADGRLESPSLVPSSKNIAYVDELRRLATLGFAARRTLTNIRQEGA